MTNLVTAWRAEQQQAYEREQLYAAYVRGPLPKNPPELLTPTRCRVLRAFFIAADKVAEVGAIVTLQRHDATSLAAIGKVEILSKE